MRVSEAWQEGKNTWLVLGLDQCNYPSVSVLVGSGIPLILLE